MQEQAGWGAGSKVYRFGEMTARRNPNGSESRDAGSGALATGEHVSVHETVQPAGATPNAAHTIKHTELICVREGVLEFTHDGRTERTGPGDVLLVAKGTLHQLRNAGPGPVSYFVVALGGDVR